MQLCWEKLSASSCPKIAFKLHVNWCTQWKATILPNYNRWFLNEISIRRGAGQETIAPRATKNFCRNERGSWRSGKQANRQIEGEEKAGDGGDVSYVQRIFSNFRLLLFTIIPTCGFWIRAKKMHSFLRHTSSKLFDLFLETRFYVLWFANTLADVWGRNKYRQRASANCISSHLLEINDKSSDCSQRVPMQTKAHEFLGEIFKAQIFELLKSTSTLCQENRPQWPGGVKGQRKEIWRPSAIKCEKNKQITLNKILF